MPRSVLIVDDSRVALAGLARLLRGRGLVVDTAESGPEALDYLRHNTPPAVIFLDHMMPGMDGFETLATLKANRQTAGIPVVMYTSNEGDAYQTQALARGAVGVVHKPIDSAEVARVLEQLGSARPPGIAEVPVDAERPMVAAAGSAATGSNTAAPKPLEATGAPASSYRSRRGGRYVVLAGLVLLFVLAGLWMAQRLQQTERSLERVEADNAQLRAGQQSEQSSALRQQGEESRAALDALERRRQRETGALLETVVWVLNQQGRYAFGELPLGDTRLALVRELVKRLTPAGFRGSLRINVHAGQFCTQRDDKGESHLAPDSLPMSQCEILVEAPEPAVQVAQYESPEFARYLAGQESTSSGVQISVTSRGTSRPLVPYPDAGSATAGEWNRVARLNQRVEFVLAPVP